MKIKTLLLMSLATLILMTAFIGSVAYFATGKTESLAAKGARAERLLAEVFELNSLTQDFLAHHEERPKVQWYLQYTLLDRDLASPILDDERGGGTAAELRGEMPGIKKVFDQLVAASEGADDPAVERQLAGELLVKTRRMISGIHGLAVAAAKESSDARRRADILALALLLLLAAFASVIALLLYRRIVVPIERLQKGAKVVGQGNLKYKVGSAAKDEVGALSRAFDDMTAKLRRSYENLEQKVKDRTRELEDLSVQNRILLDSVGDGLVAIDKEWNITLWNPAAERICGWSAGEVLGKPFRKVVKFVRRSDRSENVLFIADAMMDGKVHFMQDGTVMICKDGTEIDVGDSAAPIMDKKGKVKGAIIVFRDTSREKEIERSKNDLVSLVTHELRGPATVIQGYAELLKEDGKNALRPEHMKFVEGISDANARLIELANSLLTVFRVEFGEIVISPEPVIMTQLADDAIKQQELQVSAKKLRITKAYDDIPILNVDKRLAELAFANLLSNAVKYTPEGGKVRLEIRKREEEVAIIVTDSGMGIPKDQQGKIFGKFFRADNVRRINGVGVGLHVLKAMLERAGCRIGFESEEGTGSTFFVAIPLTGMLKVGS